MNKKFLLMVLAMVMVFTLAACSPKAPAETPAEAPAEKFVLKHAHVLAATEPYHQGFLKWAEAVNERTNGGLTIEVYPGSQIGRASCRERV